jgi:hypothetical protein
MMDDDLNTPQSRRPERRAILSKLNVMPFSGLGLEFRRDL